ncbi:hypothetical protein [Saccharopolyspora sp. 5N708]|uniref:hypothetical protein n=1 Tax=Saccharopolyspora sp. 5N708 TaxID=3457424 RepID=UPI003FD3E641
MQEELLREGMRAAVADEPPLGFGPNDLVAEARRRQRRRRAMIGAVVATLVVVVGAATAPSMLHTMTVPPASPPQVAVPEPIGWAPTGMVPLRLTDQQLVAEGERIKGYLAEAVPEVVPAVRDFTTEPGAKPGLGLGLRTSPPAEVYVSAAFARTVEAVPGKAVSVELAVRVFAPGSVERSPAQACGTPLFRVILQCAQHVQADGSVVVDSVATMEDGRYPPSHVVHHFRADGTLVVATASHFSDGELRRMYAMTQPPMDSPELIALATDPQLALRP